MALISFKTLTETLKIATIAFKSLGEKFYAFREMI